MVARNDRIGMAMNLMCMALVCLDEAGELNASTRLQHAIDTLRNDACLKPGETLHDEMADTQFDRFRNRRLPTKRL